MPMNKTILATSILGVLKTKNESIAGQAEVDLLECWELIADEIIKHIIANAVVDTITTTPGATAGPTALPGTGVGSITA